MTTRFEWDPRKAEANLRKHRVSFQVAARVFADPLRFTAIDQIIEGEVRWKTIGRVDSTVTLLVVHTDQEGGRRRSDPYHLRSPRDPPRNEVL